MAKDKLSAREAELIAGARSQLAKLRASAAAAHAETAPVTAVAAISPDSADNPAPKGAEPAAAVDNAERIAALMAAARAETERLRRRQRKLYVWTPLAFFLVVGLWVLLWLWQRI